MLEFAIAVFLMLITPGPGVLTVAGVGAGFGYGPGFRFMAGLCLGTNLVALIVISGLAAILLSLPGLRIALTWASVAFFVYLAGKIAFSGARIGFMQATAAPGFIGGLMLQFINPKAYAVNNLIFSGYPFWPDSFAAEVIAKLIIVNAIWIPVHVVWLWAGVSLTRLALDPPVQRAINIAMAVSLLVVVALAVATSPINPEAS
jgi:threonine/homoserine/homoserine lactone efflux protein